jgi:NAD(P)H-dependent FMN reductase
MLTLNIITVSTRPGRVGPLAAKWISELASKHGKFKVVDIDLAEINLPLFDEPQHPMMRQYQNAHTKIWSKLIDAGDALIFVTPEYDYFVPASLVNAIDYLAHEWHYKPAGFVGYGGASGGMRSVQAAKPLVSNMGMMPMPASVFIHFIAKYINDDNELQLTEEHEKSAILMLDELEKWATALKTIRAKDK